jgi:hypothetical protein
MPLDLPMLPGRVIQLIEEWILAGAPEAGFVATVGCARSDAARWRRPLRFAGEP